MPRHEVNARHLFCPMPVIRTQDTIARCKTGDIVHVYGTDPGMKQDIAAWCRINGHEMLEIKDNDEEIEITIEVGEHQ